jgi:hypothetical protein
VEADVVETSEPLSGESRMNVHKNARLTPIGRIHLIELIDSAGLKAAAAANGLY